MLLLRLLVGIGALCCATIPAQIDGETMFSLIRFDNEEYFITASKHVDISRDKNCLVKYRGARYRACLISTSEKLKLLQNSLQYETSVELNAIDDKSDFQNVKPKTTDGAIEINSANASSELHGVGCSTPLNEKVPFFRDQLTLSNITSGNSFEVSSSAAPSGCTDILNNIGDDWLKDSDEAHKFEEAVQSRDFITNCSNLDHANQIQSDRTYRSKAANHEEEHDNLEDPNNNAKCVDYTQKVNPIEGDGSRKQNNSEVQQNIGEIQSDRQADKECDDIERQDDVGQEGRKVDIEQNHNQLRDYVQDKDGSSSEENVDKVQDEEQEDDNEVDNIERSSGVGGEQGEVDGCIEQNHDKQYDNLQNDKFGSGSKNLDVIHDYDQDDEGDDDIGTNNRVGPGKRNRGGCIKRNHNEQPNYAQDEETSDDNEETCDDDTAKDSNYVPGSSLSNVTGENSRINATVSRSKSFAVGPPIDIRSVNVPSSKSESSRTVKKYFCPFCKKLQTKFARHLELKHKSEADVKRFIKFPKGNYERSKIIETIRKYGNFLHNTDNDLNTGILITCRQRQAKYNRTAQDYVCCSNCKGFFSKQTLRLHFEKCNSMHKKGVRDIMVMGRRLTGYIHGAASETLRTRVVPVMRDDEVTRSIQYDELLVLFANKLCDKYTNPHEHDMIRAQIRLLSRFKTAIKDINKNVDDFASIFRPQFYDSAVAAVGVCAKLNPATHILETPAVASTLGTLLKKCIKLRQAECIKKQDSEGKQAAEDFLVLFEDDFAISINKKVTEAQTKQKRQKQIILPSKEDIRTLYNFLKKKCQTSLKILETQFESSAWKTLSECTLISVQIFNRRRAGEIERLLITDFEYRTHLDENVDPDLYRKLSTESRDFAKQFARLAIRGKLGRTVPVILNPLHVSCIQNIFKYRIEAGVQSNNEYIFSAVTCNPTKKPYLRACDLMRKFSHECGAVTPFSLRGTTSRKHIATFFAMEGLGESEVADLANFMGHNQQIHKEIYRVPVPIREVARVSRLLQTAIGQSDGENGSGATSESDKEPDPEIPTKQVPRQKTCIKRPANTVDSSKTIDSTTKGESDSSSDTDDTVNKSVTKRRSTSPYGKTRRRRWSNEEKSAVQKIFGDPTTMKKLPSLSECQKAVESCKVLKNRQPQVLKTWIDNQRKALSRKNTSLRHLKM